MQRSGPKLEIAPFAESEVTTPPDQVDIQFLDDLREAFASVRSPPSRGTLAPPGRARG